jgi:hypothetical protein
MSEARESQSLHATLSFLPPGPWHARGNEVRAGDKLVAVVFCRNAQFVANQIAKLPELLIGNAEEIQALRDALTEMETKKEELQEKLDDIAFSGCDLCDNA